MNLVEMLTSQIEDTYRATDDLISLVKDTELDWKPSQGDNWWTVGRLLRHMTVSCGIWCKGFVTDTWDEAGDVDATKIPKGAPLPPADTYRSIDSVAAARSALAADKTIAIQVLAQTSPEELANKTATAPWNPAPRILALRILDMIRHLESHKSQLYYYLKLMGKPVHTGNLWGMGNVIED